MDVFKKDTELTKDGGKLYGRLIQSNRKNQKRTVRTRAWEAQTGGNTVQTLRNKKGFICDMDGVIYHATVCCPVYLNL